MSETDTKEAFQQGVLSGLAAPALVFMDFRGPEATSVSKLSRPLPRRSDYDALAGDWRNIGNDLRVALTKYGETV
jgi:hypothetical protein